MKAIRNFFLLLSNDDNNQVWKTKTKGYKVIVKLFIFAAMKTSIKIVIGIIAMAFFLASCTMERKLARQFIEGDAKSTLLMLVPPEMLFMFNEKAVPQGEYNNLDSAKFFSSDFIQLVSDSIFLENYFKYFTQQTKEYGLEVYFPNEISEFLKLNNTAYVVRFSQMELMEDTSSFFVEERINNSQPQMREIVYNLVSLSTWFDISLKDSASNFSYFDEQYITDDIYGDYVYNDWSFDYKYDYTKYDIELEYIYEFAKDMGMRHASFVYDLMMNTYIWSQLPPEKRGRFSYLHYNVKYHSIELAEEAFIMLD